MSWFSALSSLALLVVIGSLAAWVRFDQSRAKRAVPWLFGLLWFVVAFHAVLCVVDLFLRHPWHAVFEFVLALVVTAALQFLRWFQRKLTPREGERDVKG